MQDFQKPYLESIPTSSYHGVSGPPPSFYSSVLEYLHSFRNRNLLLCIRLYMCYWHHLPCSSSTLKVCRWLWEYITSSLVCTSALGALWNKLHVRGNAIKISGENRLKEALLISFKILSVWRRVSSLDCCSTIHMTIFWILFMTPSPTLYTLSIEFRFQLLPLLEVHCLPGLVPIWCDCSVVLEVLKWNLPYSSHYDLPSTFRLKESLSSRLSQ